MSEESQDSSRRSLWDVMPQQTVENWDSVQYMNLSANIMNQRVKTFQPPNSYLDQMDVTDENISEIYKFLLHNYTRHSKRLLVYPKALLKYYFTTYTKTILLALRDNKTKRILGFVSNVYRPVFMANSTEQQYIWYVNFLCVDKNERSELVAAYLITNVWYLSERLGPTPAIFQTSLALPKSISKRDYYLRPINVNNLIKANFFELPSNTQEREPFITNLCKRFSIQPKEQDYTIKCSNKVDPHELENEYALIIANLQRFRMSRFKTFWYTTLKELQTIIHNENFISLTIYKDSEQIAYIDFYLTHHIHNNVVLQAHIYNWYHPSDWNDTECQRFIDCVTDYISQLYPKVDLLIIPSTLHKNTSKSLLKYYTLYTHFFNHTMVQLREACDGTQVF